MNYNVGDTVLYGTDGVCRIEEISEQKIGSDSLTYYILKPVYNEKGTIYVPSQNQKLLGKMKAILSEDEIYDAIEKASMAEYEWMIDDALRNENFRKAIESGNITEITKVVRLLYLRREELLGCGKKLRVADEKTLKECEKILFDEVAFVLKMNRGQVQRFLTDRLGIDE